MLAAELRRSYAFDESITVGQVVSTGSPLTALTTVVTLNNHMTFSAVQTVWWSLGGDSEAAQRIPPILYAALAVGALTAWTTKRWGVLAGVTAGIVVALNPMFVGVSREVRGYSLSMLASIVAVLALIEYLERGRRWLLGVHAVALVVGVTTHAFVVVSLVPVAAAALVITRARDRRLWITWAASVLVTVLLYAPTLSELLRVRAESGTDYKPWWFRATSWELLGRDRLTALIFATMAVVGAVVYAGRRADRRLAIAVAVAAVPIQMWWWWQIEEPFHFHSRFFVSLVPLLALGVALCVRFIPLAAVAVAAGVLAMAPHTSDVRRSQLPVREVATMVNEATNQGLSVCSVGGSALAAYASPPAEVVVPRGPIAVDDASEIFGSCMVFVRIGSRGGSLIDAAEMWYRTRQQVGPFDVFTSPQRPESGDS